MKPDECIYDLQHMMNLLFVLLLYEMTTRRYMLMSGCDMTATMVGVLRCIMKGAGSKHAIESDLSFLLNRCTGSCGFILKECPRPTVEA